jgi:uncharacterized protein YkwD
MRPDVGLPPSRLMRLVLACLLLAVAPALHAGAPCTQPADEAWREEVLATVNRLRETGAHCGARGAFAPAPPLRWAPHLAEVALQHARYLAATGELSHHNAQGEGLGPRLRQSGYAFTLVAENLANGWGEAREAIGDWTASAGHCANLMHPRLREVGVACAADTRQWPWWVMTLGAPRARGE